MKCPTCENIDLMMTDRQGITIDYCAVCRGVWLDRGELDKLIERATLPVNGSVAPDLEASSYYDRAPVATTRHAQRPVQPQSIDRTHREWDDDDDDDYRDRRRYKKRESFWSQLFDFD